MGLNVVAIDFAKRSRSALVLAVAGRHGPSAADQIAHQLTDIIGEVDVYGKPLDDLDAAPI